MGVKYFVMFAGMHFSLWIIIVRLAREGLPVLSLCIVYLESGLLASYDQIYIEFESSHWKLP